MINQDSPMIRNTYVQTALALLFMRGPAINNWVLQQTERLYLKCNGDVSNRVTLMYQIDNERVWMEFGYEFQHAFTDTALEQHAYRELANYTIGNKMIDEYITQFEHLLQKAG